MALPTEFEETAPAFFHHGLDDLPTFEFKGVSGRVIAGEAFGLKANVKTHSPSFYAHISMQPGAVSELPADYSERATYVATGSVEIAGQTISGGKMAVFAPGKPASLRAETASIVMLLGGEPVGPRFIDWNFVSWSKDRIEQAKADWEAQRMKLPDLDNKEFTPLPEPKAPSYSALAGGYAGQDHRHAPQTQTRAQRPGRLQTLQTMEGQWRRRPQYDRRSAAPARRSIQH